MSVIRDSAKSDDSNIVGRKVRPVLIFKSVFLGTILLTFIALIGYYAISLFSSHPKLPLPEHTCTGTSASWQGVIPGQSTKADVKNLLGQPAEQGYSRVWERDFFLYPPIVAFAGEKYGNIIVFHDDNVVDWLDLWVANADGEFHTVAEFVEQYGSTLDQVYVNGVLDMFGPDQVYVWSECGLAVTALHQGYVKRSEEEVLPLARLTLEMDHDQLNLRYPVHPQHPVQPNVNVDRIVIRKFLFQPTNFTSFEEFYHDRILHLSDNRLYRLD
jgi:hypothetical protein